VFLVEDLASGGAKFVDLGVGRLIFGGDAGVADEAPVGRRGGGAGDCGGSGWGILSLCTISTDMSNRSFARMF
jgi:hypothetical protein